MDSERRLRLAGASGIAIMILDGRFRPSEKVASPEVIEKLLAEPYRDQAYLLIALHTDGRFYIGRIARAPVTTPIIGVTVPALR